MLVAFACCYVCCNTFRHHALFNLYLYLLLIGTTSFRHQQINRVRMRSVDTVSPNSRILDDDSTDLENIGSSGEVIEALRLLLRILLRSFAHWPQKLGQSRTALVDA